MIVITHIAVQLLIFHMVDDIDYIIQERDIMRDQDKSILVIKKITFEPCDMFFIEMVGRFVKKQDVRFLQKEFAEKHLRSLTAA